MSGIWALYGTKLNQLNLMGLMTKILSPLDFFELTFRAAPLDGRNAHTAQHDLVEPGLDVQLRVLRLDTFQLNCH